MNETLPLQTLHPDTYDPSDAENQHLAHGHPQEKTRGLTQFACTAWKKERINYVNMLSFGFGNEFAML